MESYDSTQDRMDDAVRADVRAEADDAVRARIQDSTEGGIDFNAFERMGEKLAASLPPSSPFRVTEGMLEVLDDYLAGRGQHGSKEEGRAALRQHFSDLTDNQIESCLRRWKKEMEESGAQVNW
jgi:hypothetical protein